MLSGAGQRSSFPARESGEVVFPVLVSVAFVVDGMAQLPIFVSSLTLVG
jgi:hypothetical protein